MEGKRILESQSEFFNKSFDFPPFQTWYDSLSELNHINNLNCIIVFRSKNSIRITVRLVTCDMTT